MSSVNKAIIVGNLGADPEVRTMQDGRQIANFNVATSDRWTDKETGEKKERTQWHRVVVFNEGIAKVAKDYLKKGSKVYVEGQIETRKYEKDGEDRYVTEIVLRPFRSELVMLDSQRTGGVPAAQSDEEYGQTKTREDASAERPGKAAQPAFESEGMDDGIPF